MRLEDMVIEFLIGVNLARSDVDARPIGWMLYDTDTGHWCDHSKTVADVCSGRNRVELRLTRAVTAGD